MNRLIRTLLACAGLASAAHAQVAFQFSQADPITGQTSGSLLAPAPGQDVRAADDGAARSRTVFVNFNALDAITAAGAGRMTLPLFDGQSMELVFKHLEQRAPDDFTWFGQVAGIAASQFILCRYQDAIHLLVETYDEPHQYVVKLVPGGAFVLREMARTPQPPCGTCMHGFCAPPVDPAQHAPAPVPEGGPGPTGIFPAGHAQHAALPTDTQNVDAPSQVDVLVVYTPYARASEGGTSAMITLIGTAISDMNQRLANSQVNTRVRLVWYQEMTGYVEDGENELTRLANTDGYMDEALTLRDTYRADMVALITQTMTSGGTSLCGQGYRMPSYSSSASNGFSRTRRDCIDGGTFAHELGHNFGACHDLGTTQSNPDAGGCSSPVAPYPYGWRFRRNMGLGYYQHWHTTMAYGLSDPLYGSSTRVPYYSNPSLSYDPSGAGGPYPLGDATANVSQLLRDTAPTVANWRDSLGIYYLSTFASPFAFDGTALLPYRTITTALALRPDARVLSMLTGTYDEASPLTINRDIRIEARSGPVTIR